MKFLIDAQLPFSLSNYLRRNGHDSVHTTELPDKNRITDHELIKIAVAENRVLITKDRDFLDFYLIQKQPVKLIILKTGNINNYDLKKLFEKYLHKILLLLENRSLIEITKTEIIILN